jgi:hypothetical protein
VVLGQGGRGVIVIVCSHVCRAKRYVLVVGYLCSCVCLG